MKTTIRQISLILFFILSNCMGYCQIQGIVNVSNINPRFTSIWDYDNDGDLDFSVQYGGEYPLNGYRYRIVENANNQDYFPHNPMEIDNSNPYNLIGDYDVDSDGEEEFIARYTNSSHIPFAIEKGDWDEVWTTTPLYDTIPNGQTQINGLVDFNNDNCVDLLLITSSPDRIGYLPCLGSFTDYESTLQEYSTLPNTYPSSLSKFIIHDQNSDSYADIVIYNDNNVKVIQNQNGIFVENSTIATTKKIDTLVDINSDGRLDIILEEKSFTTYTNIKNIYDWRFFIKPGQSSLNFGNMLPILSIIDTSSYLKIQVAGADISQTFEMATSYFGRSEWADFNNDGSSELLIFNHSYNTSVNLIGSPAVESYSCSFNKTNYKFYEFTSGLLNEVIIEDLQSVFNSIINYSFYGIRDIDLDGMPDILFNGFSSPPYPSQLPINNIPETNYLLVRKNQGNFNFATEHPFGDFLYKSAIHKKIDYNEDGFADFISCNPFTKQMSLFKNLEEFEWDFPISFSLNIENLFSSKFMYINNDTIIDLLYLNEDSTSLYSSGVTLPNPCQTQANIYQASVGSKLSSFTEIDFNLDGLNDLMLEEIPQNNNPTNNAETKLIYLVNNGNSLSEWTNSFTINNRYYQKTITNEDEFISTTFVLDSLPNGNSYLRMINNLTQSISSAIPMEISKRDGTPLLIKTDSLNNYLYYISYDEESIVRRKIFNFNELGVEETIAQIDSIATLLDFQDTNNNGIQELFYFNLAHQIVYIEEINPTIINLVTNYNYNVNGTYVNPEIVFLDVNDDGFKDVLSDLFLSINAGNNHFFNFPNYSMFSSVESVDLNNDFKIELVEVAPVQFAPNNILYYAGRLKFVKTDLLDVSYLGGTVFVDSDSDGIQDSDELGVDSYPILIDNGSSITNNAGHYAKYNWTSDTLDIHCPLNFPHWYHTTSPDYSFMPDSSIYQNSFNFGINCDTLFYSFDNNYFVPHINICNTITNHEFRSFNSGSLPYFVEYELTINSIFESEPINAAVETLGGNSTYLSGKQLVLPMQSNNFIFRFKNPSENFVGQSSNTEAKFKVYSVDDALIETEVANSTAIVLCAYDPNHKSCNPIGEGEEHFIRPNLTHHYKIDFQNLGNYFATNILIRDTISPHFDIHSFSLISTTHNTQVNIDYDTRVVEFKMPAIYLIPAYQDSLLSQGSVSYTIDQLPELPDFTIIENKAYIYFDLNSPIITNNYTHTISRNYFIENPLAIRLIDFDVEKEDKSNLITWTATTDETESYFRLLKSTDEANFVLLKELFIDPLAMNSTQYVVNDEDYNFENVYYKLQVVNLSGAQRDLGIRFVSRSAIEIIEVFPNPVRDMLTISNKSNTELLGSIYDVRGNKITTIQLGINDPLLLSVKDWPVGVYSIEFNVQGVDRTQVTKFVKY